MKAAELIRTVFDGEAGDVVVFDVADPDTDIVIDLDADFDIPDVVGLVMEKDEKAFGVVVSNPDAATFSVADGEGGRTYVALLTIPVPLSALTEYDVTDIVIDDVRGESNDFYDFKDVNNAGRSDPEAPEEVSGGASAAEPVGSDGGGEQTGEEHANVSVQPDGSDETPDEAERAGAGVPGAEEAPDDVDDYYGEWNDAALIGPEPDGYLDFLHQDATFLIGEMWGAKDRRNTQDGDWKAITMSWGNWIEGAPGNKNQPAFGFSRHPEGKYKEGASIVLGSSIEGARKANAMDEMFALGLDIDSGAQIEDVVAKIQELGLLALIYTSHSHGKSGLEIKRDEVMRKLGISEEPTLLQVQEFLRTHSKSRYEESFIARVRIADPKKQTKEGVKIALTTPPLDKFRIIFPLSEAVKLIDLAPTQQAALEVWEDKITGMAWEALGVHFDTSCTDPSRLFYTARHAKEAEWDCMIIRGAPLRFQDVPVYKKHQYTKHRAKLNPFEMAGDGLEEGRAPEAMTPTGKNLNDWHHHAKDRFQLASLLEDMCPDKIRHAGGEGQGQVHTECPFEHEHSKEGGTGTMAIDAMDSSSEYWTWFCHHDSCQGRHKLQFLEEALAQGWFEEDVLFDEDGPYILPPGEEIVEQKEPPKDADTGEELTVDARAAVFDRMSKGSEIEEFIKELFAEGIDLAERNRVTEILADNTALGKRDVNKMWQKLDKVQRKIDADKAMEGDIKNSGSMMTDAGFDKQIEFAGRRLMDKNQDNPFMFQYVQYKAEVREAADGIPFIEFVDKGRFGFHLNNVAAFYEPKGDDKRRTDTPVPVVRHLFESPNSLYPPLKGITNTPVFASNGNVISKPGYDLDSNLYYHPATGVVVPPVSEAPTTEEVAEAKRLLIEELLGDFPIAAKTRKELIEEGLYGDGVPALANLIAFFLLPFIRELLNNGAVAPGMLITKPAPGSGASLLVDVYSIVTSGRTASPFAIPKNEEEMAKTLSSVLIEARAQMYFDNINSSVDSGELASAMTADHYSARVLGKSATVDVPVRSTFIFTGNNVMMSGELVRRLVLVDLDTRLARPELRTGWHHADIKAWATEHRGELVWACLTLVSHWIANGRPETSAVLASYEDFCRKVGGILECAGIKGFLGNRDELKEKALDESDDEFDALVEVWWDHCGTRPIFSKGNDDTKEQGLCELAMAQEVSLPIRKERNNDGDMGYSSRGMGKLLTQYKDRIFVLEDGAEVTLRRDTKKTKRGYAYFLELNQKAPQSNV